ncbi:DUF1501 domain-containing protein [Singulisphaera acidiphila]|uniref:DUF1501 domain-containing protein n=2 Tax=Singulisphaera acidiphila TaxID=466153 RepID=L0DPF2_SINAD|nr:DUF1501 domain-containing protein [Singulisphaera acidiphila]AGA31249.1 hypothetical protein Sinac_7201 [Singulisphaera acidiphila DSM 18658]
MPSRRDFLKLGLRGSSLIALAPTVPGFLARTARAATAERDSRVLVVIQLDGGNDGINTIVPFADEGYARHRQTLQLPKDQLIKIDEHVGLHPAMREAGKLLETGRLAIVPGVGYPNPSRSHFQSMAVWQTGRLDPEEHGGPGWLGRGFDTARSRAESLFIGSGTPPVALRGRRAVALSLERMEDLTLDAPVDAPRIDPTHELAGDDLTAFVRRSTLDAYTSADRLTELTRNRGTEASYPATALADRLRTIARLLKGGYATRVFYTTQGGYDTHASQLFPHADLLRVLSGALKAFLDDLAAAGLAERVLVLGFSEFGRRVAENGSAGTDHGTAGPVLLAGAGVRPGLAGTYPSLTDLEAGDLKMSVDFRRVYATVRTGWLELPADSALGDNVSPLPLLQA